VEVGGRGEQPDAELRDLAGVVQVHRHDLGRLARRQVHGFGGFERYVTDWEFREYAYHL
jgi:hypothetical protein